VTFPTTHEEGELPVGEIFLSAIWARSRSAPRSSRRWFSAADADVVASSYGHIGCIDSSRAPRRRSTVRVAIWRSSGGCLSLVHVGTYPLALERVDRGTVFHSVDLDASAREWLSRRASEIPGARPVFLQAARGLATCAWAESPDVDLIAVGAGSGHMLGLMPDGFVRHLLKPALCSVLVVRPVRHGRRWGTERTGATPGSPKA